MRIFMDDREEVDKVLNLEGIARSIALHNEKQRLLKK